MNIRLSSLLLFFAGALHAQIAADTPPIFTENFNAPTTTLEWRGKAALGGPFSGVSGKRDDLAYVAIPASTDQDPDGPAAFARTPIATAPMSAFTFVFWYYLEEQHPDLQVPLDTAGVTILIHPRGFDIRVSNDPKPFSFTPGPKGPILDWTTSGRWIFAAFAWDAATNTLTVYQGTREVPVTFMRNMNHDAPAKPTFPRLNLVKTPEVIGNTCVRQDRPLAGRLDNLRIYERVLSRDDLERIRSADLENRPVSLKPTLAP